MKIFLWIVKYGIVIHSLLCIIGLTLFKQTGIDIKFNLGMIYGVYFSYQFYKHAHNSNH